MTGTASRAAELFAQSAMRTLATRESFHAALCGGEPLLALLAGLRALPAFRRLAWRDVHVFAVDDGWDEAAMAALAAWPLPPLQVHRPRRADIGRIDAARRYGETLAAHFGLGSGVVPSFDFVLLDTAPDGRVAGFSPEGATAADVTRLVVAHPRGTPRVALALPVLNAARELALFGNAHAAGPRRLLDPRGDVHLLSPAVGVAPAPGEQACVMAATHCATVRIEDCALLSDA